ncbi:MAG: DUF6531 domain-containing protein [Candidatus Limnocylindria bacterium]
MSSHTAVTTRVSVDSTGVEATGSSSSPAVSADGRFVAFSSIATNLVAGDTNARRDVFVHDRTTATTIRVSVGSGGAEADGESFLPAISGDGRYVAFISVATNLVPDDTNGGRDVFVHDRSTGTTERVSLTASGAEASHLIFNRVSISSDGRYVAFESNAFGMVPEKTGTLSDVFVRDRLEATTIRVSVSSADEEADSDSYNPSISADGRRVAFESFASNLAGTDTNGDSDVFVRDLDAGTTTLVSVGPTGSAAGSSLWASASSDGRYVAFYSRAALVSGDTNTRDDIFVRDTGLAQTILASTSSGGALGNGNSQMPAISANGRYVAFWSFASNLVTDDTNGDGDIFMRDLGDVETVRVSIASGGTQADNSSSELAISSTGRFVAFDSLATNLVANDTNSTQDIFVHERDVVTDDFGNAFGYQLGEGQFAAMSDDPVNLGTGSFTLQATDLAMPGRVLGFAFARWYNSADPTVGTLGPGWTHTYAWTVTDLDSRAIVRRGDGRRDEYTANGDGTYAAPPGVFDTLTKRPDGTWELLLTGQVAYDFSVAGQLTRISEPTGNAINLAYADGRLASVTDTVGRVVSLSYDPSGRLSQIEDPLGRRVTYAYDESGRLSVVTDRLGNAAGSDPADHRWTYGYEGPSSRIATITDPDGRVRVTNGYDDQGRVTAQRDGLNELSTISYGTLETTVADPRGHSTRYTFDDRLRVLSQTDVVGADTYTLSYAYDAAGNRTSVTDREGNTIDLTYDARGNVLTKTDPSPDGIAPRPVTSFEYDLENNLTEITDALGAVTTVTYDPATNVLLSVTRQVDATTTATTSYEYGDAANPGLPTRIYSPLGNTGGTPDPTYSTALAYDAEGNLASRTDADGATMAFQYDVVGRLTSFVDPDGNAPGGLPALHTWAIEYDPNDREVRRTDPLASALEYSYDGAGNRTSLTDRNGNVTSYFYDTNARLREAQQKPDPAGATVYTTTVERDENGNATRITQGNGVLTEYAFDALDRLTGVTTYPTPTAPLTTTYVLDGNGQPTSRTTGDGVTVSYSYDALARLTAVSGPSLSIGYQYDALGRRTAMTDAIGVTTYQYDDAGRVVEISSPLGTLGYGYDLDGNRILLEYPGGDPVLNSYSPGGRLETVTDWAARTSTYSYTPSGLVNTLSQHGGLAATYAYDRAQRLTSLEYAQTAASAPVTVLRQEFTLDGEGNRTQLVEAVLLEDSPAAASAFSYDYDGLSRLLSADAVLFGGGTRSETFSYDAATNIQARTGPAATYTMDGANRVTTDGAQSFTWDGADRLVQRGADTFTYDVLSRLTAATVAGATSSYQYDGDRLLAIRTNTTGTTNFVWDASTAPAPLLEAGTDRVVHGLGPLYLARADGSTIRLVRDALGSVRAEVDDLGLVTKSFRYAAYGAISDRFPSGATPTLLGFSGELADPSGLTYLRARWYDPGTGRFMSRDPYAGAPSAPASLNSFGYSHGRPTFFADPLGLDPNSSSNWAYDVASVFRDLDSSDRGTQLAALAKLSVAAALIAIPVGVALTPTLVTAAPVAAEVAGGVYLLRDPVTQAVVRTGRSIDLVRREAQHLRNAITRPYRFEAVYRTNDPAAQRGLEHFLYEAHPGAFLNTIRPVALDNPRLASYLEAAQRFLGGR